MIVVVDDFPDAADVLVRLLKRSGYDAISKSCGEELFEYLEHSTPQLVILDVNMPGTDGIACLRALRADTRWHKLPVIMYSADFSYEKMKQAELLGAPDYLVKGSVSWNDFVETIKRNLTPT